MAALEICLTLSRESVNAGTQERVRHEEAIVLGSEKLTAFVATTDVGRAKVFYRDTLGLRLVREDKFALVFDANETTLRVTPVREVAGAQYTVLGWEVADIAASARALLQAGVKLERYDWPGFSHDELGITSGPGGVKLGWFKDPDGNILSIAQH